MSRKCRSCGTPPQPYYVNDKNSVTQDHAAIFRDTQFAAGIEFPEEFVVPVIGEDIQVCVKNLINLVIGSYIWNPAYGYLKIAHWDSCTGKIGLLNDDISGAALPGTVVSEGSLWAVTARPCCADQDNFSLFPFLAEDYVIPGVGNSVTLSVTSTFGLIEGTLIRIGSNVYFLDQINSSLEIVATNQGAGGIPGSTVNARDVNGELQYLITQAVTSACISPARDIVKLIGCDGANEAVLSGEWEGQVPVLIDPTTEEVAFYLLDTEVRTCTELTAPVNVLAGIVNYVIFVADESLFAIGQILQLDGGALRWEITDNTTPGELDITCTTGNPGSNFTIALGASVCLQLCCESTSEAITELEADVVALQSEVADIDAILEDGWLPLSATGTYIGANSFSVSGDVTTKLKIGQKLKLLLNGVNFYGNIISFSFGAGVTTINLIGNNSYSLTSNPITFVEISYSNPRDFPARFLWNTNPFGFSAISQNTGVYWVIDSEINCHGYIQGTSNSTAFLVDLPASAPSSFVGRCSNSLDNSLPVTTVGYATSLGSQASLFPGQTIAAWTNSGTKGAIIDLKYLLTGWV